MNRQEKDILKILYHDPYINQRALSESCAYSLGTVNKCIKNLIDEGYLDAEKSLTEKSRKLFSETKPQNAIILAAGYGMRMVPINTEIPKGLLEVHGEPLIERLIRQLHEAEITGIYIVVGFMKECYEYLIDEYGVELIVNTEYVSKNNLHSLKKAVKHLTNTYVIPCDIWCEENPFHKNELYSWYMVSEVMTRESNVRVNRKMELVTVPEQSKGNAMIGISYLMTEDAKNVRKKVETMCRDASYEDAFWEEALFASEKMLIGAKVVSSEKVVEINTYEQLRELDSGSAQLKSRVIMLAAAALNVQESDITGITVLKKGLTNRSLLFSCKDKRYIMRIPDKNKEQFINWQGEAAAYAAIHGKDICENLVYIDHENGYKITEYIENARICDPLCDLDIQKCMAKLRSFHELGFIVDHEFDIFKQIEFYESCWKEKSLYKDYQKTKENVLSLKEYIDKQPKEKVLTHIDAVSDNFLFYRNFDGEEKICLIDWEYAGMQDPHVDIAMFCIYSLYDKNQVDKLIDAYFTEGCFRETRLKIYCYIAACGLLWSNWCEYQRSLGVEFGEYSLRQYRYAKDYYRIVKEELTEEKKCGQSGR